MFGEFLTVNTASSAHLQTVHFDSVYSRLEKIVPKGVARYTIYWPSAHPATVPEVWVRGLMDIGWDLAVGLSGAS